MSIEMKKTYIQTRLYMDTTVTIKVVTNKPISEVTESMKKAFQAFQKVEDVCTRFNPQSEVMQLLRYIDQPVSVSDILFETTRFAYHVSEMTNGLFDPTVGYTLESLGFNRHYLTRELLNSNLSFMTPVSYQDVVLDSEKRTVTLKKPIILDLGAVAKGFAIDLAVQSLRQYEGFVVDAGGDLYAGGVNEKNEPWSIGIRHPINTEEVIFLIKITDMAICTSGNYERVSLNDQKTHHLINPLTGKSIENTISSTVIAPFAMMADAFSTASFIFGGENGMEMLENNDMQGVIISQALQPYISKGLEGVLYANE